MNKLSIPTKGMMAYAVALYVFCDKLYAALKKDGHERVWFLSREGQALKTYFDLYLKQHHPDDIQTDYLYVSRLATYLPSLAPAPEERFALLYEQPLSVLLRNLNIRGEAAERLTAQLPDDLVVNDQTLPLLWENELFVQTYTDAYQEQRAAFSAYLAQKGLSGVSERVAVCDVGWKGTMQDHIQAVLGEQTVVQGYYLGLIGRTGRCSCTDSQKYGLLFDYCTQGRRCDGLWSFDYTFFERLLSADHGATIGYTLQDGVASPVLREYESEQGMHAAVADLHGQLTRSFCTLCRDWQVGQTEACEHELANTYLQGIASLRTKEHKLQRLLLLSQYENFIIMRPGKEHAGKRLSLQNAWRQRGGYLHPKTWNDSYHLMVASRILGNEKLYLFAKLTRKRAAYLVRKRCAK